MKVPSCNSHNKIGLRRVFMSLILVSISAFQTATATETNCSFKLANIQFTKCLNGAEKNVQLSGETLELKSDAKTDYFNDPDGKSISHSAPVLLAQVDNTKPFTLTAKLSPRFTQTYDAGTLYIYVSNMLWQKFAFERDERANTRIVSVRTIDTSDDNNHQPIGDKSVYLKISSDAKTVAFYFSTDKVTWNLARLYKNAYPKTIWVGISSQSPIGPGNSTLFEDLSLTNESVKDFRMGI